MTALTPGGLVPGRRRAEAFERAVSGGPDLAGLPPRDAAALRPLLELVSQVRAVAPPAPRPEHVADLRARLMAEAGTALLATDTDSGAGLRATPAEPAVRRRVATVLGGAALLGATASVAVAAQGALPGEALYPVKRAIEDVRTDATTDDVARATRLMAGATDRLEEIDELTRQGSRSDVAALPGAFATFTDQAGEAGELLLDDHRSTGRTSSVSRLRDFTGESMATLTRLEATLPDSARDELLQAAATLAGLDERAATLCPACEGAGVTEVPGVLVSPAGSTGVTVTALPDARAGAGADARSGARTDAEPRTETRRDGDRTGRGGAVPGPSDRDRTGSDRGRERPPADDRDPDDTRGDPRPDDRATPEPPVAPPTVKVPTRPPGGSGGGGAPTTTTDVVGTITDTVDDTVGTVTDGTLVGGVVDGVEDVVEGTGGLVQGTLGGLTGGLGGLTGGLTGGLSGGSGGGR